VDYDGGTKEREKLQGDSDTLLYEPTARMCYQYSKDEAPMYLFYASNLAKEVFSAVEAQDWEVRSVLIWNKNQAQFGALSAQYKEKKEPILYLHKKGETPFWNGPNNETTVWDHDRPNSSEHHPTQKPVDVAAHAIRNSSIRDNIVLDLFGGSGSTLLACESLDRRGFTMELEPGYCQVIVDRWEDLTGNNAEVINQ